MEKTEASHSGVHRNIRGLRLERQIADEYLINWIMD